MIPAPSRRWARSPARRRTGGEAEVIEDLARDRLVGDDRDQSHLAVAGRAAKDVQPEGALRQFGPRQPALAGRPVGAAQRILSCRSWRTSCEHRSGPSTSSAPTRFLVFRDVSGGAATSDNSSRAAANLE